MTKQERIRLLARKFLFRFSRRILSLIPKRKGLVLFTAWFGQKYIDNSKYVYEFFLDHSDYYPVWMTKSKDIFKSLNKEGKPAALFNSIKGRWLQVRAEAVFSSVQYADYNTWLLSRCLYIDLGHGHPIKDPGETSKIDTYSYSVYKMITDSLYYYAIVSGSKTKNEYNVVPIPTDHIYISDYARNDVFIDAELREGKNEVVDSFINGRKSIVYMPTHRSDGKQTMLLADILDLDSIERYCNLNGYVFIVKKHFYHRMEVENLEKYPHIVDITNVDDIDPQVLLYQADILISDYSACYIDYMLLKKPIVFFQYDLESFTRTERKLYYNFEEIDIAPIVYDKSLLMDCIDNLAVNGDKWLNKRMEFAQKFYFDNIEQKNGRADVKATFDQLYKQYFRNG